MTNGNLVGILSGFPQDAKVNFMVFFGLTPVRCDVDDGNVMVLRSPHTGDVDVMLDLDRWWEDDVRRRCLRTSE